MEVSVETGVAEAEVEASRGHAGFVELQTTWQEHARGDIAEIVDSKVTTLGVQFAQGGYD